jgi:hypothetical protein
MSSFLTALVMQFSRGSLLAIQRPSPIDTVENVSF